MGRLRFYIAAENTAPRHWERVQFLNPEMLPYRLRTRWESPYLIVDRAETESGQFLAVWSCAQHGELGLLTGTLIERDKPYVLVRELARGTLNRLRNQAALWVSAGLNLPAEFRDLHKSAIQWMAKSVVADDDFAAAARYAQLALEMSLQGIAVLIDAYAAQSFAARQRQQTKSLLLVGAQIEDSLPAENTAPALLEACNSLGIAFSWKSIEATEGVYQWTRTDRALAWAQAHGRRVCAGPLVDWTKAALPDWLVLWEDDFENLLKMTADYVKRVVERYKGRVQIWNAAAKINTTPALSLNDEQRLQLTARIVAAVREVDPRTPVIATLDQPAGEGLAAEHGDLPPWQFADSLARSDLGLAGLGLEYTLGFGPDDSLPRDPLAYCQQLDVWTMLNLPVILFLSAAPIGPGAPEEQQRAWLAEFAPAMLGKQTVQGIFWKTLFDPAISKMAEPGAGLFTSDGRVKPILGTLKELKMKYGV